jgi:hypothetical protein
VDRPKQPGTTIAAPAATSSRRRVVATPGWVIPNPRDAPGGENRASQGRRERSYRLSVWARPLYPRPSIVPRPPFSSPGVMMRLRRSTMMVTSTITPVTSSISVASAFTAGVMPKRTAE